MRESQKYYWKSYRYVMYFVILAFTNYIINRDIMIKALYLDDLAIWRDYDSNSLLQFTLNMGANKFRPVFYFLLYGFFSFVGENIELIGIINLIFTNIISIVFFLFVKKFVKMN